MGLYFAPKLHNSRHTRKTNCSSPTPFTASVLSIPYNVKKCNTRHHFSDTVVWPMKRVKHPKFQHGYPLSCEIRVVVPVSTPIESEVEREMNPPPYNIYYKCNMARLITIWVSFSLGMDVLDRPSLDLGFRIPQTPDCLTY